MVPILEYYTGDITQATAISTIVIIFTSTSGTYKYLKQKRVDIKTGVRYFLFAAAGGLLGGYLADVIPGPQLKAIFGFTLFLLAIRGIRKAWLEGRNGGMTKMTDVEMDNHEDTFFKYVVEIPPIEDTPGMRYVADLKIGLPFAFVGGIVGGMLGLGGGVIYVPVLLFAGLPIHIATATSTFLIVGSTSLAAYQRIANATFDWIIPVVMGIGAVLGGQLGAGYARKIRSRWLTMAFWLLAGFTGIRYILQTVL